MKKLFAIIGLCCSLILCSCQNTTTTPTASTKVTASPVVTASNATATPTTPQATATPNTSSSHTIASYYPFNSNKKYTYEGSGNEYASYTVYTDYTTATRVQFRVDNGGTEMVKVMEISNGELKEIIDEKKEEPFKLSYSNKDYLYIVVGYGKQNSGGYSISVDDLYLTSNAIYINTNLIGPTKEDMVSQGVTYPYVVVKLEYREERVVFE